MVTALLIGIAGMYLVVFTTAKLFFALFEFGKARDRWVKRGRRCAVCGLDKRYCVHGRT